MAHLLHIDSSALVSGSVSKEISTTFRKSWEQAHPDGTVTYRDLGVDPVGPLLEAGITAGFTPEDARTPEQVAALAAREALVQEVLEADAFLLSVPMYNWGVPATFKAWLDQVLVMGRTAAPAGTPPLAGRPTTVVLSYGGGYDAGTPRAGWDFVQPYLETVLGKAMGLDLTVIKAQLTLAERNPAMAELIPASLQQKEAAHAATGEHARTVAAALAV
ncbi:FMN-dependent NADH-azoreductase [Streptacidiphilus cavernicola]|uniref:FMN dependent NADH:quinone oxidoreductase n=1 Tax=Streptacidiphilus cavernicola TaxID=3342716 RepID=A0ABV6W5Z0_9ACTN